MSSKSKLRTAVVGGALIALGFAASGCASHRFVRDQVEVVDNRVTTVEGTAGQALQRANEAHKLAEGKFLYQVVLSDDSVKFPTDAAALSPEADDASAVIQALLLAGTELWNALAECGVADAQRDSWDAVEERAGAFLDRVSGEGGARG